MSTQAIPQTSTTTWNIDPAHATAEFKVKHMMISNVKGQFSKVAGVLHYDESDPTSSRVETEINASSIETREPLGQRLLLGVLVDGDDLRLGIQESQDGY